MWGIIENSYGIFALWCPRVELVDGVNGFKVNFEFCIRVWDKESNLNEFVDCGDYGFWNTEIKRFELV